MKFRRGVERSGIKNLLAATLRAEAQKVDIWAIPHAISLTIEDYSA